MFIAVVFPAGFGSYIFRFRPAEGMVQTPFEGLFWSPPTLLPLTVCEWAGIWDGFKDTVCSPPVWP